VKKEMISGEESKESGDTGNSVLNKVNIHLRSVGDAPALKQQKFKLDGNKCIVEVDKFLKRNIKVSHSLYLYCGSGFSPTPDQRLIDLFENFQVNGELVISYGLQEAWG